MDMASGQVRVAISNYPYQMFSPVVAGLHYGPSIIVTSPTEMVN
jgi:hypothetical protein